MNRQHFPQGSRRSRERRARAGGLRDERSRAQTDQSNPISSATGQFDARAMPPELWPVAAICVAACLSLGFAWFAGNQATFLYFFPLASHPVDSYWALRYKAWWVACTDIGYVAVPVFLMAFLPAVRFRDCNLSFTGFRRHFWTYVGLYAAVLPLIWLVSLTPTFFTYYPMYSFSGRSWFDLLAWEGLYAGQFVALEFFFRGFLVGGLSKRIGILAVPVSVMPYMMIHFTKPAPEAAASIVAGLVLGYLAWKTKSIWGGVCVHCAVASTMDFLALAHKGQLPWLHG